MANPPGGWSSLWRDNYARLQMAQEDSGAEFTTRPGYRDPARYRGTAAGESLPQALPEGIANDG